MPDQRRYRFESASENDPGEVPPSSPTQYTMEDSPESYSLSNEEIRRSATKLLHDTDRSMSGRSLRGDSEEEKRSFSDHHSCMSAESPVHDLLPSVEEYRTYLAANGRGVSSNESIPFTISSRTVFINSQSKRQENSPSKTLHIIKIIGALLLSFFGFALFTFIMLTAAKYSGSLNPTNVLPSDRFEQIVDLLSSGISDKEALMTSGTAQYLAAQWIADVDPIMRDIPDSLIEDSERFLQRYILAVLFFSMNGDEWYDYMKFLSEEDECAWYTPVPSATGGDYAKGVTCRGENLVVKELYIPGNNLIGTIPSELKHLSQLDLLSLSHNFISNEIPNDLNKLSLLRYLDLGHNQMNGTIPDWLGDLEQLEVIGLSTNNLDGTIPSNFASLKNLVTLALDNNQLTGDLPNFSEISNLSYLYLGSNMLDGTINEEFLEDLFDLQEVDLSNNFLQGNVLPQHLLEHSRLRILDVSKNLLNGDLPKLVKQNYALRYLSVRENYFFGTIPPSISSLVKLTHLDLEMNALSGEIPPSLGMMNHLNHLFIGRNAYSSGTIPNMLSRLTKLRELSLAASKMTGEIPKWLGNMKSLKFIDLQQNDLTGPTPDDLWNLPQLSYLLLNDNQIEDELPLQFTNVENLAIVALHKNRISGNSDPLCTNTSLLSLYTIDCHLVRCTSGCCPRCCSQSDSETCFDDLLNASITNRSDFVEDSYISSFESFSLDILV